MELKKLRTKTKFKIDIEYWKKNFGLEWLDVWLHI